MPQLLYIVARDRPDIHRFLLTDFAVEEDVEIILDRRVGDRRWRAQPRVLDRRSGTDRRSTRLDRDQLSVLGWVLVDGMLNRLS